VKLKIAVVCAILLALLWWSLSSKESLQDGNADSLTDIQMQTDQTGISESNDNTSRKANKSLTKKSSHNSNETSGTEMASDDDSSNSNTSNAGSSLNDEMSLSRKALMELMNDEEGVAWQEEYDKGEYDPSYDATWQDDMLNEAYELISDESFASKAEIKDFTCEDGTCRIDLKDLRESGGEALKASDIEKFSRGLKYHPAILKSGKQRDVYIDSISFEDGGVKASLSVH